MIGEDLWRELERDRPSAPGIVRRRVHDESDRDVFVGVNHDGHRLLILSVDPTAVSGLDELEGTRALHLAVEPSQQAGKIDIRIVLVADEMSRVFTPFVEDVVEAVAASGSDASAVAELLARFGHWRRLLAAADPEGLGPRQAQGLYGELWCMRHLILPVLAERAVTAWTGPNREDRDFQVGGLGVEVKTTVGDNPPSIEIGSERQLQTDGLPRLFLVAMSLDALPAGSGETLNEIVDDVTASLAPRAQTELRDRLLEYGYAEVHRSRYDQPRYTLRELWILEVGAGFPRVTEHGLPPGVGRVRYQIALTACGEWRRTPDELKAALSFEGTQS